MDQSIFPDILYYDETRKNMPNIHIFNIEKKYSDKFWFNFDYIANSKIRE